MKNIHSYLIIFCLTVVALSFPTFSRAMGTNDSTYAEVCQGQMYRDDKFTIQPTRTSVPGVLRDTVQNTDGSYSILVLTIHPTYSNTHNAKSCDAVYTWEGRTYHQSCRDTVSFQSVFGCDSIEILNLTFLQRDTVNMSKSVCDSLLWYDSVYRVSGSYSHIVPSSSSAVCDSLILLTLVVNHSVNTTINEAICNGETFSYRDTVIRRAGTYHFYDKTVANCDSTITLNLRVNPVYDTFDNHVMCSNDPKQGFTWIDGKTYYSSTNTPRFTLMTVDGCDSSFTLDLTIDRSLVASFHIEPEYPTYENSHICLTNTSKNAISSLWYLYDGTIHEEDPYCFDYPINMDTVLISLVTKSSMGCSDTATAVIQLDRNGVFVPNAFTPNLSTNNFFQVRSNQVTEMSVYIFNRRGLLITNFDGLTEKWDGTYNGVLCPQSVYTYYIYYRTQARPNETQSKVGTVMLLR